MSDRLNTAGSQVLYVEEGTLKEASCEQCPYGHPRSKLRLLIAGCVMCRDYHYSMECQSARLFAAEDAQEEKYGRLPVIYLGLQRRYGN